MRLLLAACLALLGTRAEAAARADVAVLRDGDRWTAEFRFSERARAWMFTRSALTRVGERPWRPQSWRVETPGVRLERRGHYDLLVAADGGLVPARVRIALTPFPDDLIADYDTALVFSNGAIALYSEQFATFPFPSAAAVARLPLDLNGVVMPDAETRITFRDAAGPVLFAGRRSPSVALENDEGDGYYVLFGPADPIVTEAMAAIFDPALPTWIRDALAGFTPRLLAHYAHAMGPAPPPKPTLMVSWAGPTARVSSMGGSVLSGLVTMAFEGEGMLVEDAEIRDQSRWFIAHESAHFWLGQAVRYEYSRDAWITEGGADLLAIRAVAAIEPDYDAQARLQRSLDECVALSAGRGVASAEQRNEHRAYYACGAIFALVAESAGRRPFSAFVRGLIEANRGDRIVSRGEWLAALDRVSGDRSLSRDIALLLDRGLADPRPMLASLLGRAGVAVGRGGDGRLVLS